MDDKRTSGEKRGFVVRITAVFVEKILRVQPNVKKLYLLIRAADAKSALQRFNTERNMHGTNLQNFLSEKVTPVAGDITCEDMGIQDPDLKAEMWRLIDVVVNALGEMIVGHLKGNIPVVILRPTIITSTYLQPFPGWVEGISKTETVSLFEYMNSKKKEICRTIDSLALGYGKGRLTCFLGDPEAIYDVVPADMVVNAMIATITTHANQTFSETIYHVGSSVSNPLKFITVQRCGATCTLLSIHGLTRMIYRSSLLPSAAAFAGTYKNLKRKINFVLRLVDLYKPYLFTKSL
ncbi:hypothetical protein Ccrd_017443 [Cynara cardunculus var. scolymus]|uniref:Fatty acyl-CoA reductase n=1 Tax=Cynara cardunculus var. scolymus TaxID=59895 RepID=A0A103Y838_CYNCS|nr:hypothetical protein Ccrd_017443 [Cynara cardunculus var. scolymus]